MTAEPPLLAGAVQDTVDWVLTPFVPETAVGAPGVPTSIALDAVDGLPVPLVFFASTANV